VKRVSIFQQGSTAAHGIFECVHQLLHAKFLIKDDSTMYHLVKNRIIITHHIILRGLFHTAFSATIITINVFFYHETKVKEAYLGTLTHFSLRL
jgi:hypothetical protein